jgi:hypothetical protein
LALVSQRCVKIAVRRALRRDTISETDAHGPAGPMRSTDFFKDYARRNFFASRHSAQEVAEA